MADHFRTAPDWEDVRFFVALARHGSLSAAARALGVNHATVSRRVAALEASLGARLLERRPDGYALTAPGRAVLQEAAAMESAAERLPRFDAAPAVSGLVRISAPPSLAESFLTPRFGALFALHPDIDIALVAEHRLASLSRREADLALRLGRPEDGDIVAKHLVDVDFGFYADAAWQTRHAAGAELIFIGFDEANAHLPEAVWLARHFATRRVAFRAGSQAAQARAAASGYGIALLPHFVGRSEPRLVRLELGATPPLRELWLLHRPGVEAAPVRAMRDALIRLFAAEQSLFASGADRVG
jgi:molybdate transport repressor ModE-like protein